MRGAWAGEGGEVQEANCAESPGGVLIDQFSARGSHSDEEADGRTAGETGVRLGPGRCRDGCAGRACQPISKASSPFPPTGQHPVADPSYDPLQRWFLAHYTHLYHAGKG